MKMHRILLAVVACGLSLNAAAQWQWIDKDGRKVFSDQPPPAEIPDKSILKQPNAKALSASPPAAAPAPAAAPQAPRLSGKDKELEEKKAQAEAEETAKKKAEEEQQAKVRADNCARARQSKTAYDSGRILSHTNAKGERVFMDEATRAAETRRINEVIASDCGPQR
jgi:type IV secretory pathway VirB10-like protein